MSLHGIDNDKDKRWVHEWHLPTHRSWVWSGEGCCDRFPAPVPHWLVYPHSQSALSLRSGGQTSQCRPQTPRFCQNQI